MKLLLIEDNLHIATALKQALASSYDIDHVSRGGEGVAKALTTAYDGIILDLNLPDQPGLEVCKQIRNESIKAPILILTGETRPISKITLLDAGADDYLTKPFSLGELKARLRVLMRRTVAPLTATRLTAGDLVLDSDSRSVSRAGKTVKLRRKEFALLECLLQNAGNVVTREMLSNYAWRDSEDPWTNTIDVHIKYLRDKIDRPFEKPLIKTVHGVGYKLEVS